jgi:hypothetical protein
MLQLEQDQRSARQRHATARHDAFLDRGAGRMQRVIERVMQAIKVAALRWN